MFKAGISPEIMMKLLQVPKTVLIVFKAVTPICLLLVSSLSNFCMHSFWRLVTSPESLGDSSRLIVLIFYGFAVDLLLVPPVYLRVSHMANICHMSFTHLSYLPGTFFFLSEIVFCSMISVVSLPGATLITRSLWSSLCWTWPRPVM